MTEQSELLQEQSEPRRGRGRLAVRILIPGLVGVVLIAALLAIRADGGGSELATDMRPADDAVVCDPLAPDHPYCVREPDPTSTTIDPNEVSKATTTSTTVPLPTTVPAVPPAFHLEGSDGTLRVVADLDVPAPLAGQVIHFNVKISEVEGRRTALGVSFGDGGVYGLPGLPTVTCGTKSEDGTTTTTTTPPAREATETVAHSYRLPGEYIVKVKVVSANCTSDSGVVLTGRIVVGPGVSLSNGPLPPVVVGARQLETSSGPKAVSLNVHVRDPDGFISSVTIKWGDGATETKQYALGDCVDPKTYWPGPTSDSFTLEHAYAASGAHEVEVTVESIGCGGADSQSAQKAVTVTAAA